MSLVVGVTAIVGETTGAADLDLVRRVHFRNHC
jgi:hypothetical protein